MTIQLFQQDKEITLDDVFNVDSEKDIISIEFYSHDQALQAKELLEREGFVLKEMELFTDIIKVVKPAKVVIE